MDGALNGIRVIDFSTVVMGPYATQILGDLGADVVKVESPAGDSLRVPPPYQHVGMSSLALGLNRNKRAIAVDLKDERGKRIFRELVATADVLVTNMRPQALERLGVDFDSIRHDRLVYCQAQGFSGELRDRAAYDEIVQGASGTVDLMMRATGTPDYVPTVLADKVSSLTIAYSVLAALMHRERTGLGQHVEVPMTETMLAFNLVEHLGGETFVPAHGPLGFARSLQPNHRAVRTKDGYACIATYGARNVADFFTVAGRPDLAEDPRFDNPDALYEHFEEFYDLMAKLALERTTDEWEELCSRHSIPFGRVAGLEDLVSRLDTAEHPSEGTIRVVPPPVRFSATPASVRRHAPRLGEHNAEILAELGYTAQQISELSSDGVTVEAVYGESRGAQG
ncbi:CoA transferase [Lentzea sp. NPDC005914]|uniref:CaiB/BaiF CoA transferase family protein n=1 Tax=Lentzea sp. NPDC005914 TaxID=3154572 RepID=UPI0033DCBB2A